MGFAIGENIEVSIRGTWQAESWFNVWQYTVASTVGVATAAQWGEGWWNHVKTLYRTLAPVVITNLFQSVLVKSIDDPAGDYGEFAIPSGESVGLRGAGGLVDPMPTFNAAAVRLAVATRATRPGQKRFTFLYEADSVGQYIGAAYTTGLVNLMDLMTATMILGAPVATGTLQPVVVRKDGNGIVVAAQDITGYAISPFVATQGSRKVNKGM